MIACSLNKNTKARSFLSSHLSLIAALGGEPAPLTLCALAELNYLYSQNTMRYCLWAFARAAPSPKNTLSPNFFPLGRKVSFKYPLRFSSAMTRSHPDLTTWVSCCLWIPIISCTSLSQSTDHTVLAFTGLGDSFFFF